MEPPVTPPESTVHPEIWPSPKWPFPTDAATEKRIADLLKRMTVEEKVGQVIQADISAATPADAIDAFVAGHSLRAFEDLLEVLADA